MPTVTGTDTGGATITSYNLVYNGGGSSTTYTTITGENPESTTQTFTKSGLTADTLYTFKYRVKNKFGWGSYSPSVTVRSATVPS